jgi:predicted nuclease with RNAse H fold
VIGVDVGEEKKGFHLVALGGSKILGVHATQDPLDAAKWCLGFEAKIIGVDAPSGWSHSPGGKSREAERLLAQTGHSSYSTPSRDRGLDMPTSLWVFNGERLYQALAANFPLFTGRTPPHPFAFETYPYLATCAYAGRRLKADDKTSDRRDIVRGAGIDDTSLRNIDFIDATICALVAYSVNIDYFTRYGNAEEGFILAPPLY